MGDPRLGPHLLIGGSHDGEREEFDAFVTERVRKINVAASTKPADARYGKTIAQMAAEVVYEDYDRVVVRREPPIFIYIRHVRSGRIDAARRRLSSTR